MAETKVVLWLVNGLVFSLWSFSILLNIDTWKSNVSFAAGLTVLGVHTYWKIRKNQRDDRKAEQEETLRDIEIEHKKNILTKK